MSVKAVYIMIKPANAPVVSTNSVFRVISKIRSNTKIRAVHNKGTIAPISNKFAAGRNRRLPEQVANVLNALLKNIAINKVKLKDTITPKTVIT